MLKAKALTQKTTATYCTTANTLYLHSNKIKSKNAYTLNSTRIIRNVTQQQLNAFNALPQTFMQNAKRFPHTLTQALQKIICT